jgi:CrcB protein
MNKILLLLAGGAIGTLSRYFISTLTLKFYEGIFPLGTLVVNLIGSFVIGLLWGFFEQNGDSTNLRAFVFVGILGGFTTLSSFSLETMNLFRDNEIKMGILNILANNILALLLVFLGFILAKGIITIIK